MQRGSFFVSEVVRYSPHSIEPWADPYRGKLVEFGETVLAHLPEVGKGSGNSAPDGNPACGRERAITQTNTMSEQTMELRVREVYDNSQRTAGQKRTSRQSSRPHRSRGR